MDMYLNVCSKYPGTAWVMRLPDHLSLAGVREWDTCHILFKQPDAVCLCVRVCHWFTALPLLVLAAPVVQRFLPSGCYLTWEVSRRIQWLQLASMFCSEVKRGQLRRRCRLTFCLLRLYLCVYITQAPCSLQTILRCGSHLKRAGTRLPFQRSCTKRLVQLGWYLLYISNSCGFYLGKSFKI